MLKSRARRLRYAAACLAIASFFAGQAAFADTTISDLLPDDLETTLSGSFLAAMNAAKNRDLDAATVFFEEALSRDPKNPFLLDRTFTLLIASGNVEQSFPVAERLVQVTDASRMAQIALGIQALKAKKYQDSAESLNKGDRNELSSITSSLLAAWAAQGSGETDAALKIIDTTQGPPWFDVFKRFNTALILDVAGRQDEALAAIQAAYKADPTAMRVVEAYARMMARAGKTTEAREALDKFAKSGVALPIIKALSDEIAAGKKPAPMVANVADGGGEVLYGIGSALSTQKGGDEAGLVYLRLALYLDPKSDIARMALAEVLQGMQDYDRSSKAFDKVSKTSPLRRTADMQIAFNYDAMGKRPDAIRQLKKLAQADPKDPEALTSLGTLYRGDKHYLDAADYYTKAISVIEPGDPRDWLLYYYRGIAYQLANEWPKAEADLRKSLELSPNQPQVMNYLGYSWIDQGINIDEGTDLIKKAVELKPDDGYIVDSLGWAYYKTDRYPEAVAQLERAVSLLPDDPTINDHLGDAYWKAGRQLEATFQWAHARDLNPEKPEDKARILAKLAKGLDKVEESRVASATGNTVTDATTADAAKPMPKTLTIEAGDSLWKIAVEHYGDGDFYTRLIEANRTKLANPNRIFPGLVIELPAADGEK
ncbi:tetratricopeptide (TPR) repeat protein [Kaistia hirudinis]|uniref:Tetratricopeptide (TPR) repeat protein n=1 Tax=Kaistia hirudinis TaxID=1293440 RepID=A0A840AK30_9HYPH|nr:tetratricopeptide repeat protein [Kaistia hirudinis]MBB3930600.1 tetratricopeptide (TPR) repeat protein [Kaistia hirudinis]